MGNGIAQTFATCGVETFLIDVDQNGLEKGVANIHKSLARFVAKEKLSAEAAEATKSRLHSSTSMDALGGVDCPHAFVACGAEGAEPTQALKDGFDDGAISSNSSSSPAGGEALELAELGAGVALRLGATR